MKDLPETVICQYQVRAGHEAQFEALLARHWPALHAAGLTTDAPARVYRGRPSADRDDASGRYVEVFEWKTGDGPDIAHQTPAIMAIWEPMGAICSAMHFPHFDRIEPAANGA